jgi:hypothetical protein
VLPEQYPYLVGGPGQQPVPVIVVGVRAAVLRYQGQPRIKITCTAANTDYSTPIPASARYISVCVPTAAVVAVALGQATSSIIGYTLVGPVTRDLPILYGADAGDGYVHAQSETALTGVWVTFLQDMADI